MTHGKILSHYDRGATPFWALSVDKRVSYCLFVPDSYDEEGTDRWPLVVLVHGTERGAGTYRDLFSSFADRNRCIILAPLFPANLAGPGDLDSYKLIEAAGMRFDYLLLAMVDEVAAKYRLDGDRFLMHGFSGGGHFAHRFFYLHPERLAAVSIGAPGVVTLLDPTLPWWRGLSDLEERFGSAPAFDRMRNVPVQMIVGAEDTATWEITIAENSDWWMPGANDAGATRIERLRSLEHSFASTGVDVEFALIEGVAHEGWKPALLSAVESFFERLLVAPPRSAGANGDI